MRRQQGRGVEICRRGTKIILYDGRPRRVERVVEWSGRWVSWRGEREEKEPKWKSRVSNGWARA